MKYHVDITDSEGKSFGVRLSLPFSLRGTTLQNSSWRVLDEGFLRYRSGGCNAHRWDDGGGVDVTLFVGASIKGGHGVQLLELFDGYQLVNSSGDGDVAQPWVVGLKSGPITWSLIS